MEQLDKAYEALELLEKLGLPVSREQYAAVSEIERNYIEEQVLPVIKQQLEPLLVPLKNDYSIVLTYSHESGLSTTVEESTETEEGSYTPRTKRYVIQVEFPDGRSVCHRQVLKTLLDVVEYAGADRVRSLNIPTVTGNLIAADIVDNKRYLRSQKRLSTGEYVQTCSDTNTKFKQINEINKRLGLGLVVKRVPLSAWSEDDKTQYEIDFDKDFQQTLD